MRDVDACTSVHADLFVYKSNQPMMYLCCNKKMHSFVCAVPNGHVGGNLAQQGRRLLHGGNAGGGYGRDRFGFSCLCGILLSSNTGRANASLLAVVRWLQRLWACNVLQDEWLTLPDVAGGSGRGPFANWLYAANCWVGHGDTVRLPAPARLRKCDVQRLQEHAC